jgi:hypothetical protein
MNLDDCINSRLLVRRCNYFWYAYAGVCSCSCRAPSPVARDSAVHITSRFRFRYAIDNKYTKTENKC